MRLIDIDRSYCERSSATDFAIDFDTPELSLSLLEDRWLEESGIASGSLDKVYHSESMHEMEVNADLQNVDLCNPHVLLFLAKTTAYHHAFWPHTAKRFLAFKNILRKNKDVRRSLSDKKLLAMLNSHFEAMVNGHDSNRVYDTPGRQRELKNMKQVISIVEKAIAEST